MTSSLHIQKANRLQGTLQRLSSSKSISNRALILQALSGNRSTVSNLSEARDTVLMNRLVTSSDAVLDVMDAGTTMRFLTAYVGVTNQVKTLTGTARMKERPLGILVDALRALGVSIDYLEKDGFPPIQTRGFHLQRTSQLIIPGHVSSQFISALMMVAPILPQGLTLTLTGKIGSVPYIEMTAALMEQFGVRCAINWQAQTIKIPPKQYSPANITVEADWSAISYWYGFTALADTAELTLPHVSDQSVQGDRVIAQLMESLGVRSTFKNNQLLLSKQNSVNEIRWDFKDCPDLAQTVIPVCAAKGIAGAFTGLESLRIKETDRIAALQMEISKIGAELTEPHPGSWHLKPGQISKSLTIDTYHDHRMAMGFAPWATQTSLIINDPDVVNKSYPGFWEDMAAVGFVLMKEG